MSLGLAILLFFGVTLGLVVIPFMPGILEWWRRTDAKPLRVVLESEVEVRHFAQGFRAYIESHLKSAIDTCRKTGTSTEGMLDDKTRYIVVPSNKTLALSDLEKKLHSVERMILSCGDLNLPAETMYPLEIYAGESLQGGERNIYRAVLAEDRIRLGNESISLRWLHAGGVVHARPGCVLYGRISADGAILMADDCRFERLNAPLIEFGRAPEAGKANNSRKNKTQLTVLEPKELPHVVEVAAGRWLIDKKLEIPEGRSVETDLVVTGWAKVGGGTRIIGSMKSQKDLYLENGVEVTGSVVSGENLFIGEDCRIRGPVLAEGNIYIEQGTVIGTSDIPTTISAKDIMVASGSVAYGTIWAHKDGRICPSSEVAKCKKPPR